MKANNLKELVDNHTNELLESLMKYEKVGFEKTGDLMISTIKHRLTSFGIDLLVQSDKLAEKNN